MEDLIFKIRHKESGKFVKPQGGKVVLSDNGKTWSKLGHVQLHISEHDMYYRDFKTDYEIVKYIICEDTISELSEIYDSFINKRRIQRINRLLKNYKCRLKIGNLSIGEIDKYELKIEELEEELTELTQE